MKREKSPCKRVKQIRRRYDPDFVPGTRLESHHMIQKHNGGADTIENLRPLTLAEHAHLHYIEADMADSPSEVQANQWATGSIVGRMQKEEFMEFSHMTEVYLRRRR